MSLEFERRLAGDQKRIEEALGAIFREDDRYADLQEAMEYSLMAGGKRVRPVLTLECCRLCGGDPERALPFACGVEMVHTYSLIHDDLPCMDNDELRRGKPTTWKVFGYDMAVLAGDALMIFAFETAAKALKLGADPARVGRAIGLLAEKTGIYGMIGGQTVDVELTGKPVSEEQLDFIYRLKTGALLEASMMIGAILAGADENEIRKTENIAADVGLAFQIRDDILDIVSSANVLGKPVLSDEKNSKTTYVTLKGLEQAKTDVEEISHRAASALESLPGEKEFLKQLIEMLVNREN